MKFKGLNLMVSDARERRRVGFLRQGGFEMKTSMFWQRSEGNDRVSGIRESICPISLDPKAKVSG